MFSHRNPSLLIPIPLLKAEVHIIAAADEAICSAFADWVTLFCAGRRSGMYGVYEMKGFGRESNSVEMPNLKHSIVLHTEK